MITIPKAGVVAGQSAQLQVGVDQSGGALSQLGDRMAQLGHQWRIDKINRETRKGQLAITQDMAMLRLNVDQIGDPSQIGPAWDAGVAEIRKQYLTDGQDPLLRENLGLAIDDLSAQHTTALADQVIKISQSQDRADLADFADTAAKAAGGADDTTFDAFKAQGLARIAELQDSGQYSPEEAQKARAAFLTGITAPRLDALIAVDPDTALSQIEAGTWNDLSPEGLAQARVAARAAIATREKATAVTQGQAYDAVAKELDGMAEMLTAGNSVQGLSLLNDPAVAAAAAADPKVAKALGKARAAADLQAELPGIRSMTPAQLDAAIATEAARPKDPTKPWDADRLGVLKQWRDQAVGKWASDPVATAATAGLQVPELPDFDPANPQAWASGLSARMSFAGALTAQGYANAAPPFSKDEQSRLTTILDPKADVGTKLALAEATVAGAGKSWTAAAAAMGASDEMRGAMAVLAETGDRGLAGQILSGQQKIATDLAAAPTAAQLRPVFAAITGGLFDRDPARAAVLMKAAAAAYADAAPPVPPGAPEASLRNDPDRLQLYTDTLQRMLGATPDTQGQLTIGGIQKINDAPVLLPNGVSSAWVQQGFDLLAGQDSAQLPGLFAKASLTGAATPDLGDDPGSWLTQSQLVPVPNRPGLFTLQILRDGRALPIRTKEDPNKPYVFDLRNLMAGVQALDGQP